ncbi:hypothetical protein RclHR1_06990004 [Rhizophagus clarus]|uniref:HAT C-terminal dimerisation domain-containing protein n=1 Tax=Rhizophagus clarus TaxID=94130 RepID=A0A2Z6RV46_9GLOM|nr:hypothetical protein RclHR1_06990004 [Rhizophagus clarus]
MDNENEEIARQKRLRTDVDSGKIWKEKVVIYLKSMSMQTPSKRHFCLIKAGDHNVIGNILVRALTKKEQPMFERLLLRITVSNGFPFQWIENQATLDLFEFLNPNLILPGRKTLSTRILKDETDNLDVLRDEKLSCDKIGVMLAFDGWKNVLNQHIFGSLFITSSGEILIWKASDISSERERMIEIIPKIGCPGWVVTITLKSWCENCEIAKNRELAGTTTSIRISYIVFLPCFAYQCQLAICDIFKESLTLKTASAKAIIIAAYFKNRNNSYFIGKLQDIQKELYNKYYSIMVPGEIRWNSHYFCFKSLVQSKQALRNLTIWHERLQLTPEANSLTLNTNEIYLNDNICKILLDNDWWNAIETLQEILIPYCGVLNKLQSDKARLFELLHALGYFVHFWNQFSDVELGEKMIERLEKRWSQWEQPLLLLSFMLHSMYRLTYFNSTIENLSFTTLGCYLTYYYKAWFQKRPIRQFGDDVFKFWKYVEGDYKELAGVALRIFGIYVNSASVERMWSFMGFFHTNRRNRLNNDKVLSMSKLHISINFSFRKKELQKNQAEFLNLNAKPVETEFSNLQILDDDSAEVLQQNPVDNNDDGNVESENDILTSERWERELAEWKEMLTEEEVSRLEEEEALRDNPGSLRGDLLTEYTHLAIDTRVKWQLKILFSFVINIPAYLKSNEMV